MGESVRATALAILPMDPLRGIIQNSVQLSVFKGSWIPSLIQRELYRLNSPPFHLSISQIYA